MKASDERGVALVMVLILMGVISVLGASLVLVSQTETWSSQNYRLMTEARYGAESGAHKAADFLMDTSRYTAPGSSTFGSTYTITTSPVKYGSDPVVLSSTGSGSNYPSSTVVTNYTDAVHGTLTSGTDPVTYDAIATLVSMRAFILYGSATPVTIQTWKIVGRGTIGGAKPARIEVETILERQVQPVFSYAAFATDNGCGALTWYGNSRTDSYDSGALSGGNPVISATGGNVGTNGNLNIYGNADIGGTLSTPRVGVGACSAGAVTAITGSLSAIDGLSELPQSVSYPLPDPPTPLSSTPFACNNSVLPPGAYGDITCGANKTLHLTQGTYNINSITLNGQGSIVVDSGPAILNVAGYATAGTFEAVPSMADPIVLQGGSTMNVTGYDPSMFQITYRGSHTVTMMGNSGFAGLLYAPNSTWVNGGTPDWYGAVIARTVRDYGAAKIHYDRRLSMDALAAGPWMIDSFSWKKM
mgnify:CR=1 FL=1